MWPLLKLGHVMGYVTKVNKQLTKFRVWKIDIFSYF